MKRTDPQLKAVVVWGAILLGVLFWAMAARIVVALAEWIAQAF